MIPNWILVGGVTSPQDARVAEALGADAIALVLTPGDPRAVRLDMAAEIAAGITIETVVEMKDPSPDELRSAALVIQPTMFLLHRPLSAEEIPPLPWFRSFPCKGRAALSSLKDFPGDRYLLQVAPELIPGEPGWRRDRSLLREAGSVGAMVLGGVTRLDQLPTVIEKARPWGLRLRSCVERAPGWLDHEFLDQAMATLRGRRRR